MHNQLVRVSLLAALVAAVTIGCQSNGNVSATPPPGKTSGSEPGVAGKPGEPKPPADLKDIAVELKHDAFLYNGLDRTKAVTYVFSRVQGEKAENGTQSNKLKTFDKTSATFAIKRTGSLESLGEDEILVKPDGIYLVSTSQGKPKEPVLQMPAKLAVGTVWSYDYPLTSSAGGKMTLQGKARVEAEEKVTVGAGPFETIRVSETANLDNDGKKATVSMKTWYAKSVGIVKMKMELKDGSGKIVTSTMELTGTGG